MSESFALTGRIVGVKPRGKPKDGVQTFWTLEIQENPTDKYPRKVSFNSHEKSGEVKLDWPIVNQAMTSGQPVTVHGYTSPNSQNPDAPYKNGTDIEWATGGGAQDQSGFTSDPVPTGTASPSAGSAGDDPWEPTPRPGETSAPVGTPPSINVAYPPSNNQGNEWDERSFQMEAAWAVKAVLDNSPEIEDDELIKASLRLCVVKRSVASELKGWA